jgi:chromosome segregation ATPase
MDRDEIHHKMSKKVAQLTKVIFHLNTRNDEADNHLAAVQDAYEQEIDQILREANSKVQQAARIAEKCKSEGAAQQVDKLRKQYEEEKREALSEVQNLRSALSGREQKNNAMWTDRMKQMSGELLSIKQQCTQQSQQFKTALQTAEEQYSSRLAELTSQHKSELESAAKTHADELRLKLQERADAEAERVAELKRSFDQQLEEKSRMLIQQEQRCETLEAELRDCRARLDASLSDSGAALQEANAARERLNGELQQARAEIVRLEQVCAEHVAVVKQRDEDIESLQNAARRGEDERRNLQGEVDALQKQLSDSQARASQLEAEWEALQQRMKRERDSLESAGGAERSRLEDRIHALEAELEAHKVSEAKLRDAESAAKEQVLTLEAEVQRLKDELVQLRDASAADQQEAMGRWQSEKQSLEDALEKQKALVQQLQRSIEELTAEMQRRLEAAASGSSKEIDEQRAAHAAALEALKRQHSQQLSEETSQLRKAHATELQDCKDLVAGDAPALSGRFSRVGASHRNVMSQRLSCHRSKTSPTGCASRSSF